MQAIRRGAMDARSSARAELTGGLVRFASPSTALLVGGLALLSLLAEIPLQFLVPQTASPGASSDVLGAVLWFVFGLSFTLVGVVVARREPRNPMGWLLLGLSLAIDIGSLTPAYAYLDYKSHHGALPLGPVAVLLSGAWTYGFLLLPLVILLFPDGRVRSRWRWPLRAYFLLGVVFSVGVLSIAVGDLSLRLPVDSGGNLIGLSNPSGANAWFAPVYKGSFVACLLFSVAAVAFQVRNYRRASGERRQQLKWLGSAATICVVALVLTVVWSNAPAIVSDILFPVGLTALPLAMGVGILRYRLYEIDRLVSRTLAYAILTALLVGTFIGLVALTTNTLAISGRVGVAASTLAAAALFNPLRIRIQRLVDRRFNRARYDAEATVAAFTARLRDAVELDAIRADLLDAVNRAVQPTHASVWIKPHARR
jgi:hypothetical protein